MVRDAHDTAVVGSALGRYPSTVVEAKDGTQTVIAGRYTAGVAPGSVNEVRTGESASVRVVGSYRDPANPRLMHEGHRVYRLDQSANWRLRPSADAAPLLRAPVVALRRDEYAPGATRGETGREIMASRRAMEQTAAAVERVEDQQRSVVSGVQSANQALANNQGSLLKLNEQLSRRVDGVEARQREAGSVRNLGTNNPPPPLGGGAGGPLGGPTPGPTPVTNPPTVGPAPGSVTPPSAGVY